MISIHGGPGRRAPASEAFLARWHGPIQDTPEVSMRRWIALAFLILSSCANPLEPNTALGVRVWATVSATSLSRSDPTAGLVIRVYVHNPSPHEVTLPTRS